MAPVSLRIVHLVAYSLTVLRANIDASQIAPSSFRLQWLQLRQGLDFEFARFWPRGNQSKDDIVIYFLLLVLTRACDAKENYRNQNSGTDEGKHYDQSHISLIDFLISDYSSPLEHCPKRAVFVLDYKPKWVDVLIRIGAKTSHDLLSCAQCEVLKAWGWVPDSHCCCDFSACISESYTSDLIFIGEDASFRDLVTFVDS